MRLSEDGAPQLEQAKSEQGQDGKAKQAAADFIPHAAGGAEEGHDAKQAADQDDIKGHEKAKRIERVLAPGGDQAEETCRGWHSREC